MSPEMLANIKRDVLFDQAAGFMALFSPEGFIWDANKAVLELTGRTLEEIHELRIWEQPELQHDLEVAVLIKNAFANTVRGEQTQVEVNLSVQGQTRTHDIIFQPIRDDQGAVIAILAEGWDVTERKKMEKRLNKNEQLYRILARSAPGAGFAVFDKDLRFLLVEGQLLAKALKLKKEATEGRKLFEVFPKAVAENVAPYFFAALRGESGTVDYTAVSESIRGHAMLLTYRPVPNPDGTIDAGLVIVLDIESLKEAEREQQQRIEELKELNRRLKLEVSQRQATEESMKHIARKLAESNHELQQFAYVASHDLQEPLRMVASYLELLARSYKDKQDEIANEFIAYAMEGAGRMRQMIQDLLQYSRVGTQEQEFVMVKLEELLPEVEQNLSVAVKDAGAVITHDPLPEIYGDRSQLVRLFQNLISNAIKFRRPEVKPQVHIGVADKNNVWEISVKDNGIGIPEKDRARIFQIFQRLHTREEYEGAGIGLAVSKKIVERHGGEIGVVSAEGEGTTFYFTIPKQSQLSVTSDQ